MRVFVRNRTAGPVHEMKPGIGNFSIPRGGQVEIFDVFEDVKMPDKTFEKRLKFTKEEIANSIVQDYGIGLEVVRVEEKPEVPSAPPVPEEKLVESEKPKEKKPSLLEKLAAAKAEAESKKVESGGEEKK